MQAPGRNENILEDPEDFNDTLASLLKYKRMENARLIDVENEIHQLFTAIFASVPPTESLLVNYLSLETITSPEHLQRILDPETFAYLNNIQALHSFHKILKTYNIKQSEFQLFASDPVNYLLNVIRIHTRIENLKEVLNNTDNLPEELGESFAEDLQYYIRQSESLPPGLSPLHRLNENLERYVQPFKFLSKFISRLVIAPLLLTLSAGAAVKGFLTFLLKDYVFDYVILDTLTGNLFNDSQDVLISQKSTAGKRKYLDSFRMKDKRFFDLSDPELVRLLAELSKRSKSYAGEHYETEIIDSTVKQLVKPTGREYLKLVASSIYEKLFVTPWHPDRLHQAVEMAAWPLRLIVAVPVFIIAAVVEGINRIADYSLLVSSVIATSIATFTLLAVNAPLMLWDAPSYFYHKIKNAIAISTPIVADNGDSAAQGVASSPKNSYQHLLVHGLLSAPRNEEKASAPEPIRVAYNQQGSPHTILALLSSEPRALTPSPASETSDVFVPYRSML